MRTRCELDAFLAAVDELLERNAMTNTDLTGGDEPAGEHDDQEEVPAAEHPEEMFGGVGDAIVSEAEPDDDEGNY
jgi:hypothetical protein